MRSKHLIFILMTSLLFTACDAGRYYARKKIDRHYEEVSENKTAADPRSHHEKVPVNDYEQGTTPALVQNESIEQPSTASPAPHTSPVKRTKSASHKNDLAFISGNNGPREEPIVSATSAPVQKQEVKKISGEKTVGKGLLMILVALLLLLLAFIFLALGDLGLIFAIVFWIGAVVLLVAGIIVMFINN